MTLKEKLGLLLAKETGVSAKEVIFDAVPEMMEGDIALPCFSFARAQKKNPAHIAQELALRIKPKGLIASLHARGPYLNISLSSEAVFSFLLSQKKPSARKKIIVIDYSSPNIAKPFGVGHLRSTFIGEALKRIANRFGYKTIAVNHLGDWGTQFGKLIVAYKRWPKELKKDPIRTLCDLYVRFHKEVEKNPDLEDSAREWFKKLEQGDREAVRLWKKFRAVSLKEFQKLYKRLDCSFDSFNGEAFYNDKIDEVIRLLERKKLLTHSEGADIVDLSAEGLPPALIRKSDGASLYITRDIAAALYRFHTYRFDTMVYEVGSEQQLHFKQLFAVLARMGYGWAQRCVHVSHGLYLAQGKKMSTRKGSSIFVEDLLDEVRTTALKIIKKKNPGLVRKEEAAEKIALGAVRLYDLKTDREQSLEFDIAKMLDFQGETGPYLQYTAARIKSILRKAKKISHFSPTLLHALGAAEREVLLQCAWYEDVLQQSMKEYKPDILAKYLIILAKKINTYYTANRVLHEDAVVRRARVFFMSFISGILEEGMTFLGIPLLKEM